MLRALANLSLQWRVPLAVGLGLLLVLGAFAVLSLQAVNDSREQALQERLLTAQMVARHIDLSLEVALSLLQHTAALPAIDLADGDNGPEAQVLRQAKDQLGLFGYNMFLLDADGNVVVAVPEDRPVALKSHAPGERQIQHTLSTAEPAVSGLQCSQTSQRPIVCLTVPVLDDGGRVVGALGGSLELSGPGIGGFIGSLQLGETGYAQVVDQDGLVLADTGEKTATVTIHSSRFASLITENRSVVTSCHSCHEVGGSQEVRRDVIAFAPLSTAPWGVALSQAEAEVFAPAHRLQQQALLLSSLSFLVAILLAWFSVRAVVRPVVDLTGAAERIAGGDLSAAIAVRGTDEVGRLARAFETMRLRLRESLGRIQGWNRDLEEAVARRTRELEESQDAIRALYEELQRKERARSLLLRKVITAQEEERRRIARELHDETSQALTALAVGLEAAVSGPDAGPETVRQRLAALKSLVLSTLEEVHNLIFDLRPACLDDLGLVAALQWYAEKRLEGLGIACQLAVEGEERRLPAEVEAAVFRVVQEAITNVIKHAEADAIRLRLRFTGNSLEVVVADDGRGFDADRVLGRSASEKGYGLLGMRERIDLLGGRLDIASQPGLGTEITVAIPLAERWEATRV